jgi:superfamily II RNA helicase
MVKICSIHSYPKNNEEQYKEYFDKFKYPLYIFQKWAIEGIVEGHHVLVTAPTGSGKTLPSEFAIDYFYSIGKKTIYCSPIKALSNQKFYDFTKKYSHISIGLITGDIKTNPDADVLIMTTEILLNKLYQINSNTPTLNSSVSFDMNIKDDLGCVVFDEIHMINDSARGHVWENSIMLLPSNIQIIGLSATLDDPEKFAYWLENRNKSDKIVYLSNKLERAVPLTHYSFISVTNSIFKIIKDKSVQENIRSIINKSHVLQDAKGIFNDTQYLTIDKMIKLFENKNVRVKRSYILNQVSQYLVQNEMLPALCYVFSRKQIEKCAKEITTNLLEFDSKVPYTVKYECEQIIRKLPNYQEYLHLPEYTTLVSLLEKGIGTHHSGMMPILREIVEILFARGYIKLLFCTETVAIGLNLPVKTTIFTDVNKHDGETFRMLYGHEFVQASGRAGRLGLDQVGHVIHLNNLFKNIDSRNYKIMMNGKPQTLISKFKISYNLVLNLININDKNLMTFAEKSMVTNDIDSQLKEIHKKIMCIVSEIDNLRFCSTKLNTPKEIIEEYIELQSKEVLSVNKYRREIKRRIKNISDSYKHIESDKLSFQKIILKEKELNELDTQYKNVNNFIRTGMNTVLELLKNENFIATQEEKEDKLCLTYKGIIASHLREIPCLIFAQLYENNTIDNLNSRQLASLFSCFTNITVSEEIKDVIPKSNDKEVQEIILNISKMYIEYQDKELKYNINAGVDYSIHYDLVNYVSEWCECNDINECKLLLQKLSVEKEIFLGEFVKALLKINNISSEMEKISELMGNIAFLSKLREIPNMTLKYVVTNQSLYV